jgi:predicted small lipoprotein YifL
MKKKITTAMLIATMSLSLMACGSTSGETSAPAEKDSATETAIETELTETEAPATEASATEEAFEEITVVDNDECTIKITGIDPDNAWGYTLKAYMENKSSDKTYMFAVKNAAVNGVQSDPLFANEIAAGKKSNEEITFYDDLAAQGITDFTDIELSFIVYDSNDWDAEYAAEETVHVYPYGEDNATKFEREAQDSDNIIVDNDDVTVIVTGYDEDTDWGYTANIFVVNKTDKELMFSVEESSVNGYMIDPYYAISVAANKCAFSSISWPSEDLESNGIDEVNEIEFELVVYDSNDWTADYLVDEVITLNP